MPRDTGNIYGEVATLSDIRDINKQIRHEMREVKFRSQPTELKKRSDYFCTLTFAPSWQTKFGDETHRFREVAKEEDERTTRLANELASSRNLGKPDDDAWQGGNVA